MPQLDHALADAGDFRHPWIRRHLWIRPPG
jgi:hypothetical protein